MTFGGTADDRSAHKRPKMELANFYSQASVHTLLWDLLTGSSDYFWLIIYVSYCSIIE